MGSEGSRVVVTTRMSNLAAHLTTSYGLFKMRFLDEEFASPSINNDIIIMENLEVLKGVDDPSISEDVVKRIPNIKKLQMVCNAELLERVSYASYLECFSKLESLKLSVAYSRGKKDLLKMSFPPSLKKLNLCIPITSEWEDILPTIGSLPLLQELILNYGRLRTRKWETIEVMLSAKRILDEQEELHGDQPDLHVSVAVSKFDEDEAKAVQELASSNFKVTIK
ncbi:uncharacterized protein LOC125193711 isoform X2 [Salvia hispanica]|uniref:uncharacterized protein LOC125193711 isoform X2 n=1 Tax=Salvia hispanica TaxID=49212 RepID=UPI0020099F5A|nr:uncharacterized protein LOC125193711 isoform X2 [Salvia hispanica]